MGAVDPLKGPPSAYMMCSYNFKFNSNDVNIYIPKNILYLTLLEPSARKTHVKFFVAINSGKVKYILTFRLVVRLLACVYHCIK